MLLQRREAEEGLLRLVAKGRGEVEDRMATTSSHSYYSSYIPLQVQSRFDDELTCTFPYLRQLQEAGRNNDRLLLLLELSEFMKRCKEEGRVEAGWLSCLQKYLCGIDSLLAVELYLELKKRGTPVLDRLHREHGGGCLKQVFFERVCAAGRYVGQARGGMLTQVAVSIEAGEELNHVTLPKTMKTLFCTICLLYDCGQHGQDEQLPDKQFQYLSPTNIHPPRRQLELAISLLHAHQMLVLHRPTALPDNPCSPECYKMLKPAEWAKVQSLRMRLLSPVVRGLIVLGIEMHSYSPCDIWNLLTGENPQGTPISCSLVFLFLIEEYHLASKLHIKLAPSEADMLLRETQLDAARVPEPPRKTKRRLKMAHAEHPTIVSACCHYFVGEEPCDLNCDNCQCRTRGFCLPQCLCPNTCALRRRGCNCKKDDCRSKRCPCYVSKIECDPLLCRLCFLDKSDKKCRNNQILLGQFKRVRVGRSTVGDAGLGLFAAEKVGKDELVMIYSGELIDQSVDLLRESLSIDNSFYNFGSPEGTIDARFMGNQSRFINHADQGNDNLRSENIFSEGRYKIAFYAERDIEAGEELFFDYDGEGELYKNYKHKYPFINRKHTPERP